MMALTSRGRKAIDILDNLESRGRADQPPADRTWPHPLRRGARDAHEPLNATRATAPTRDDLLPASGSTLCGWGCGRDLSSPSPAIVAAGLPADHAAWRDPSPEALPATRSFLTSREDTRVPGCPGTIHTP